jgi:lambda repressor-like predicted transcriptional regulator
MNTALIRLAEKKRRVERERLGPCFQPPATVAEHIRECLRGGWTQVEIAAHADVSRRTLHSLLKGERPVVHRNTVAAILALRPDAPPGRILPTGSMRRIQGLAVAGWPIRQIARDSGLHEQFLRDLVVGRYRRIPREHAAAIERVCRARFLTPGPSKATRTIAARHGWVPVTAWPDIDDPACVPDAGRAAA